MKKRIATFLFCLLTSALFAKPLPQNRELIPAPDGLRITDARYVGTLSSNGASWTLDVTVETVNKGVSSAPLLDGEIALLPLNLPNGLKIARDGSRYVLVAERRGRFNVRLGFVAKTEQNELWNRTAFTGPAATIASVTAQAPGSDTEIQLLSGTVLDVARTNGASRITGYLGAGQTVTVRWRPKVTEVTRKALLMVDSTLAAQVASTVIKYTSSFHYDVVQGKTTELLLSLPATQTLTRVEGNEIRDWRVSTDGSHQILAVELIKPLANDYVLTLDTEQSVESAAENPVLSPPQPINVDHEAGSLVVSAENTLVDIQAPAGLHQVNAPGNAVAAYEFDTRPIALTLKLAPIEPEITVADRVAAQLEETRLIVSHHLVVDVEKAGIYTLELTPQPGFIVADVRGNGIEDWNMVGGKIEVDFSDRVLGSSCVDVQLEQPLKQFPDDINITSMAVTGAASETADVGAAAAPGIRLRTGALSGLREIPVDRLPNRSNEILAYTANNQGWNLSIGTEHLAPRVVADVFNLVTIGDGVVGGSATIRYSLVNQGVQEFKVSVPDSFKNVEFTGPNIRSKELSNGVWTVGLQDKVWGGYTLVVTYDYQFDSTGAQLPVAGIHALDVERETGSIAITTAANLQINTQAASDSLHRIDEMELSVADRSLVTRAVLLAFQYSGGEYVLKLQVNHLPEQPVLEAVADRTQITSVLTDSGEMLTQASFMVKNNEKQFQRFQLPSNAALWGCYVDGQPAKPDSNGSWILVPLPRGADRDQAFAVDIMYAQTNGVLASTFGKLLTLAAPRTDVPNTYAEWRLFAPPGFRLSDFGGSMTVAEGTTYGIFDAWEKFLAFYGEVLRAAGRGIVIYGLLAFVVIAFVIAAVRRGWNGVLTLFTVMTILMVLSAMLLPVLSAAKRRAQRINSVSNLKQVGLAARIFAGDNNDRLPWSFEEMSNELSTDKITYDVETGQRFTYLGNGMSMDSLKPDSVLAYSPIVAGHCNILFADGSVEEASASTFQALSQRGLVQTVGPAETSEAQNEAITKETASPAPMAGASPVEAPTMLPPAVGPSQPVTMATASTSSGGAVGNAPPPAGSGNLGAFTPPVVAGVRSIHIELPETGQPFLFTKVLNIRDEPLSIHARIMPLSVFQAFQMAWQSAAFVAGLLVWSLQWRCENRNTFVLTVALALIVGSVCSLLVQWRALHDVLIIGFPVAALGIIALLIWKYWPRHRTEKRTDEGPDPETPVLAGGVPPVVATILLALFLGTTGAKAQSAVTPSDAGCSIVSATYEGMIKDSVASVDAVFEFSPGQSGALVPLLGADAAVRQFTVKRGRAELVREGDHLVVHIESRDSVRIELQILVQVTGEITRHELAFNIPPALSCQAAFVIDEPDASVEFPGAVSFRRISEKDGTRVEGLMGSASRIDLLWTPGIEQAGEITATVFCQNAAMVTFGGGLMHVSATMDYQITQGELRRVRIQLPAGQRLLRVRGPQIRAWQITNENGAPTLLVDLIEGVSKSWSLNVESERNLDVLPASLVIAVPHAAGVQRETGFVALKASDGLAVSVETASGLDRVDAAEFPGETNGNGTLQSVFQYSRPDFSLHVRLETIQPQVDAVAVNRFRFGTDEVALSAALHYAIKRTGIFSLEMALPDGYRVENVQGENIQQQYERKENGSRVLHVTLKARVMGDYRLNIQLTRDFKKLPKALSIMGIEPLGVERLTGYLAVSADPGVALKTQSFDGLIEIPSITLPDEAGAEIGSVLAYKFVSSAPRVKPLWNLTMEIEPVSAWVRAEIVNTISFADTLVSGRALVRYDVANAPVKELSIKAPSGAQNVEISGSNIRSREQDGDIWRVDLQSPVLGSYMLTVTWEQPSPSGTNALAVVGASAKNVERETGLLSISARAPIQVAESGAEGLQRVDNGDFPDWAGAPDPATALVYRYVRPGYRLFLDVRRLDAASVLQAIIENAQLTTVVAVDGQMMTEMSLSLQSNGRQFLKIALPPGATVWSAFVAGQAVQPGVQDGALLLPIEQSAADDGAVSVDLTYVGISAFPRGEGQISFASPGFDVPLKNARWEVYLPPDYDYSKFQGTMTRETASAAGLEPASTSFSLLDYSLMQQTSKSADARNALQDVREARRELELGNVREAGANLYRARTSLGSLKSDEAGVNRLEWDLQRAQASNLIMAQDRFSANNSGQTTVGGEGATSGPQSTSESDYASAAEQWAKLQQAQEIATARIQPLHVNLPIRGLLFTFSQVLQTETGKPMTIQLFAANAKAVHWPIRIFEATFSFLALWALVATFSHFTLRGRKNAQAA